MLADAEKIAIADALIELLDAQFTVILHGASEDGEVTYSGSAGKDGDNRHASDLPICSIIEYLNKKERRKRCTRCKSKKPLTSFTTVVTHSDGRASICKECLRKKTQKGEP